jgi:selenide, water dikinase
VLLLTKPLGTGVVGTAIKFNRAHDAVVEFAVASMRMLNKAAAEAIDGRPGVHACTDVTGFGLLGHATGMARASGVTLRLDARDIPLLNGVLELVARNRSGGMSTNREYFSEGVDVGPGVPAELEDLLYDPQTSGGLLLSIEPNAAEPITDSLRQAGVVATRVGEVAPPGPFRIIVR